MNSGEWARLAAAFEELCDRPGDERRAALARLEAEDAGLARELSRMLAADGGESRVLGRGAQAFALEDETTLNTETAVAGSTSLWKPRPVRRNGESSVQAIEKPKYVSVAKLIDAKIGTPPAESSPTNECA